ncbi:hypothetical protein M3610_13450 [Neobacillus sp. MER 74]|uniref:hypothetical protein n=1 Tax=Neobacillus sp. MER 74 TaxID=2939566 RepID=UPI0020415C03|nr:hypothetical protein [Neobacillus sp. MER 74]MCM3116305.1 hypothetical protein [Neobacillus sp. MER 74]
MKKSYLTLILILLIGILTACGSDETAKGSTAKDASKAPKSLGLDHEEKLVVQYYEVTSSKDEKKVENFLNENIFSSFAPITFKAWKQKLNSNEIKKQDSEIIKSAQIDDYNDEFKQAKGVMANLKYDNGQSKEVIIVFVKEDDKYKILHELEEGNEDFNNLLPAFGEEKRAVKNEETGQQDASGLADESGQNEASMDKVSDQVKSGGNSNTSQPPVFVEQDLRGAWHWQDGDDFYMIIRDDLTYSYIEKGSSFVSEGMYRVEKQGDKFEVRVTYTTGENDSIMMLQLTDQNQLVGEEDGYSWRAERMSLSEAERVLAGLMD